MKELRETFGKFEKKGNYAIEWKQLGSQQSGNRRTQFSFKGGGEEAAHEVKHSEMPEELLTLVRKYRASANTANKDEIEKLIKNALRA